MGKRGQPCKCCVHRERAQLDLAIARRVSAYALAKRFGVSTHSIYRHRQHMPPQLTAQLLAGPDLDGVDLDRLKETESQSLLGNLVALRQRLFASLDTAEEAGDANMVARVANQLHRNIELVAKLLGDLGVGSTTTTTNILLAPQYVTLRVELVRALAAYPDAREAVATVLHALEGDAAEMVTAKTRAVAQ